MRKKNIKKWKVTNIVNRRQLKKYALDPNNGGVFYVARLTKILANKHGLDFNRVVVFPPAKSHDGRRNKGKLKLTVYGLTELNQSVYTTRCGVGRNKELVCYDYKGCLPDEFIKTLDSQNVRRLWVYDLEDDGFTWREFKRK